MINLKNNDVILFQGDSITDGNRGRSEDPNHIHGHGYQYILASEMYVDNLWGDITVYNRGVSGNRVVDLYDRWKEDCLNLKPTILSILVGINDLWFRFENNSSSESYGFDKIYRCLLDEAKEQNPDILFVIMEPFFGKSENEEFDAFCREHIAEYSEITRKIAEDYNAVFVPLQDLFDEYSKKTDVFNLLWDGVHPTTGGHQLIAQRWKSCVEKRLNDRNNV
ncbi:MAG: lysophospholipase [Ruminococcaceae bacterium]|nr:lysophospholipase [Oscillospiraceae bacterium]